jgi:hypothetical protein
MNVRKCLLPIALLCVTAGSAAAQMMPKARVADLIKKVENGVDEFRKYLERRGDNARTASTSTKANRRTATQSQKANAEARKDDLDEALGELNRSTNRLRRKSTPPTTGSETKVEVSGCSTTAGRSTRWSRARQLRGGRGAALGSAAVRHERPRPGIRASAHGDLSADGSDFGLKSAIFVLKTHDFAHF